MGVAPPLDSMRIEEKTKPVVIETDAIFAIGMLSSLPPIHLGLILATLSGEISIRVGKITFPDVNRLAVKTRGAPMRASIGDCQRTTKSTTTEKYTRTGLPLMSAGR